ncbi:F-box protein [Estrella lausannensis]|uniref:F-box domain-containing protein n=1 Tax=Estrella lausannensis TaxID=483423 RepID=A0A0H5DPW5_9BACT|nr:F-box protein [Estrella lausannensis]CRX38527.1 hypothetical protein ELAC_1185 [Estrella lausannensis]
MSKTLTILKPGEVFLPPPGLNPTGRTQPMEIEGRSYRCHFYHRPLSFLERAIKSVALIALAALSLLTAFLLKEVRNLGREIFRGYEARKVAFPFEPFSEMPDDVLRNIMSRCEIPTVGRLASVNKRFDECQRNTVLWAELASSHEISIPDGCANVREFIRYTVVLDLGVIDLARKRIVWRGEETIFGTPQAVREAFFHRAVGYFEKRHYLKRYFGNGAYAYYYKDSDGVVKFVRSASRQERDFNQDRESEIQGVVADMTPILLVERG